MKLYVVSHGDSHRVTPYLNRLIETVQIRGDNMF